jgi:tRNA(fMet)-specific endonuclease VapC
MRLAIDTNRYTDFARSDPDAVRQVQQAEQIVMPFVVLAELRAGFAAGSRTKENESLLRRFLQSPRTSVMFPDERTIDHYVALYVQLRRQGTPIPTSDIWIAALVLQHGLTLFARDAHFDRIPQLPGV